ncbi:hypothetical protein [Amycolatopsis cihanbeyliensis]|uniref:Uncharacterized protein n=1 Tax=Amycolatopsis cihanbeyliensis TaxID=1128664 RepID=A0A542DNQ5_AMYCI|nr:hypothetical protein [Amycolatopsis cihanbeyliensis]TQJ04728.1 hypothetical protein FB471_4536 [Amycolatopsis cihanbeyliensis]
MTWLWIGLAAAVLACGALVPVLVRRRHTGGDEEISARARYLRLGHYVDVPEPADDPEAATLLRKARERWHSSGAILATAASEKDFEMAGRLARQGLRLVGQAYRLLGLPGPK